MDPQQPGNDYPGYRPADSGSGSRAPAPRPVGPGIPPGYAPYPGQAPYGQYPPHPYPPQKPFSTKAIVAMVLGGVSVLFWPLGPLTGLAGVIFGVLGMKESKEPGGTHRGWGLALGGLLTSAFMFLVSIALFGLMVWVFSMAEENRTRMRTERHETEARADLMLIRDRLKLYAIENNNSLAPGGPVVRDGWSVSYDENSPRVIGIVKVSDLVREVELDRTLSEYSLELKGERGATVRNNTTGTTMTLPDVLNESNYEIEERGTR
jgi:hypothetical protein